MTGFEKSLTENLFEKRENAENEEKHPTYESEMDFYTMISQGKVEEVRARRASGIRSDAKERGVLSPNPVRNQMYHFVVMIAMITRFCMDAGLEQDVAYEMSDLFIRRADAATTRDEIAEIQEEAIISFTKTMQQLQHRSIYSKQIILCIDYISEHLNTNITVLEMAEYVKLNETYLSKLFKKETGVSISEFIRNKKVEEAQRMLRYTDRSSIEIATDLGFSSHSYFISVFKKVTGMTPREYRNKYFRKNWENMGKK